MKVIVVGNGGREHAIAWKLSQSSLVEEVICVPGNGGTAFEDKCRNIDPEKCEYLDGIKGNDIYVKIAQENSCGLAVIGPENPLAEGLADSFWNAGIPTVGPKKMAAQLEASKDLAKSFMHKYNVACAKSRTFTEKEEALSYIHEQGAPIVIKADGLAAGKGVVVAKTVEEAEKAVNQLMDGEFVGDAGKKLVIEEYLRGTEISILSAVCVTKELSGQKKSCIVPFLSARDHKRLCDGAKGPNTGGMGAIAPVDDASPEILAQFEKSILAPTLKGLEEEGYDYRGFIFFGLMLTEDGPKCLEYNVRLGDPETQAVLPLMDFDFAALCASIADGSLADFNLTWKSGYQVAPVAVSGGYPRSYKKGFNIVIDEEKAKESSAKIFIAGAMENRRRRSPSDTKLVTNGGRVLACSAYGSTFDEAWKNAYSAMSCIKFTDMFYRKDIGLPGAAESN
ncbi:phosphoribosylamine--glycine ligase [Treponema sp.]|uniref:phosphoribosylamine--glycine ligase n=1 Tax=Treponema sp. TaxID=166 RepID=UPI003F0F1347